MDKLGVQFLREYLATHTFGSCNDYNFFDFYKIYSAIAVKSYEDLQASPQAFKEFILNNLKIMKLDGNINPNKIPGFLDQFVDKLSSEIRSSARKANIEFAKLTNELAPSKDAHILEVGSGTIPYASIKLAEFDKNVSSLDVDFMVSAEALKNMKVNPLTQKFKKDTPVDEYDFIVGKFPCEAIEPMVEACSKANKPYLIKLCNHPMSSASKYIIFLNDWRSVLPKIDPNVKFYGEYAFNIDATEEQIKKLIDFHENCIPENEKENRRSPTVFTSTVRYTENIPWFIPKDEKPANPNILQPGDYE